MKTATVPASPCTNVCRMHAATGWCEGCLRRIDEIAGWRSMAEEARHAVLAELPARRERWEALVFDGGVQPGSGG
jgi:predicted Fe-S protein YdhL (DUF1289 family)